MAHEEDVAALFPAETIDQAQLVGASSQPMNLSNADSAFQSQSNAVSQSSNNSINSMGQNYSYSDSDPLTGPQEHGPSVMDVRSEQDYFRSAQNLNAHLHVGPPLRSYYISGLLKFPDYNHDYILEYTHVDYNHDCDCACDSGLGSTNFAPPGSCPDVEVRFEHETPP